MTSDHMYAESRSDDGIGSRWYDFLISGTFVVAQRLVTGLD